MGHVRQIGHVDAPPDKAFALTIDASRGAGAVVYSDGRPFAVVSVTIRGDRIVEMDFILRPERLRALGLGPD